MKSRTLSGRAPGKLKYIALCLGGLALLLLLAGGWWWQHRFHNYTPIDALKDLRVVARLRHSSQPVQDFLTLRYGPQDIPANREKVIMDFFNPGHIEGLYLIAGNRTDAKARATVGEVARTFAAYRQEMTAQEKSDLHNFFSSDAGKAQLQAVKECYQSKDPAFRSTTEPVVKEFLATVAEVH
jgi:hypothetical protein